MLPGTRYTVRSRTSRPGEAEKWMNAPEILAALAPIVEALEELGVAYHIGGSVASSVYGIPRLTIDADLVADLRSEHVRPLVNKFGQNCSDSSIGSAVVVCICTTCLGPPPFSSPSPHFTS